MIRRITITLDHNLESKIRAIQAKKILESKKSISFSTIIKKILENGVKDFD